MISLPLFVLLSIYGLVVLASVILWCINVYHIISSASMTPVAFLFSALIACGGIAVIFITWIMLGDIVWTDSLPLIRPLNQEIDPGFDLGPDFSI